MKTKSIILTAILITASVAISESVLAQGLLAPWWKVTVKVVDESGAPIEGAEVGVTRHTGGGGWTSARPTFETIEGRTDADGEFTASTRSRSNWSIGIGVSKRGYYDSLREYEFDRVRLRRWRPWNPTVEMLLKERKDPITMYAKNVRIKSDGRLPLKGEPVGYDLSKGDWVRPHGEGVREDILFHSEAEVDAVNKQFAGKETTFHYFDGKLTVSFPNEGDGLIEFRRAENDHSDLISSQVAPEEGYEPEWVWIRKNLPDPERFPVSIQEDDYDEDRHFYLRVRTELDSDGNVVNANYGKIYGDIRYHPQTDGSGVILFEYYLNPDPNDRRMEFDSGKNLLELPRRALVRPDGP